MTTWLREPRRLWAAVAIFGWVAACSGEIDAPRALDGPSAPGAEPGQDEANNLTAPDPGDEPDPGDAPDPGDDVVDPGDDVVDPGDDRRPDCVSDEAYFLREVWTPVLQEACFNCHNPLGVAAETDMVYLPAGQVGFLEENLAVFQDIAAYERDGVSVLLLKPTAQVDHFGGKLFDVDSPAYQSIESMLARLENPTVCPEVEDEETFFEGVVELDPAQTLRKATLHLAGRLPLRAELEMVELGGEQALEAALDRVVREEAFYARMEEMFNDTLLVEKYLTGTRALDLLNRQAYPGARWFDDENYDRSGLDTEFINAGRRHSNDSVAREPLKMVSFLLREDRPFTELLTADYMIVNPFSAMVYGIDDIDWDDPMDPEEYRVGRIDGVPHAGVLTSPMFLNRFPTTATNRNRHRARITYLSFLATDVLKLAERPIDPTSAAHNPTMNDPQCSGCHSVIDPLAGAFQNWDTTGQYLPPDSWYENMRSPGFGKEVITAEERLGSLQWLARRIVSDRRFGHAMAHIVFKGLTGQSPLALPTVAEGQDHALELAAYEAQQRFFDRLARDFEANGADLRVIVKGIARSPWFRATGVEGEVDDQRLEQLRVLGTGRMLTPEMLNRKLQALMGYPWRLRVDRADYLVTDYRILYGGIDSDDVIERITEPNGIMTAIQTRMANEMACHFVARDFVLPTEQRLLFPHTELVYLPEDANGFEIPEAVHNIKTNIQHLHWHFHGEVLALDDPEINATYGLFYETWREGIAKRADGTIGRDPYYYCQAHLDYWTGAPYGANEVRRDDQYIVRSWMAVITYMLMDYRFLYE